MSFQSTITDKAKYVSSLSLFIIKPKFMTNMKHSCSSHKHCVCTALLMKQARTHVHAHTQFISMAQQTLADQGLRTIDTSQLHSVDPSGRGIGTTQRPLPDNSHNRKTNMTPVGFETAIPGVVIGMGAYFSTSPKRRSIT